jgi:hypothetical protein
VVYRDRSQSCGRSHHPRQRERRKGHAFKRGRREQCVQMPAKMVGWPPRLPLRLPGVTAAVRASRLSCGKAGKAQIFRPVQGASGETRSRPRVSDERASRF